MGAPHFFSVFFACLYYKYRSEKMLQLSLVFESVEEQEDKINKIKKFTRYFFANRIIYSTYIKVSEY